MARALVSIRVLVDATILKPGLGGIRTYIEGLASGLSQRDDFDVVVVTGRPDLLNVPGAEVVAASAHVQSFVFRTVWRECILRRIANKHRIDLIVAPVPELPVRASPCPTVVTIHDVSQVIAPQYYGFLKFIRFLVGFAHVRSAASELVFVSNATKLAFHQFFGLRTEGRVIGVGPGLLGDISEIESLGYALYVGTLQPQKNLETVVRALVGTPVELRIAGRASESDRARLESLVQELGLGGQVRVLGPVSPAELDRLYAEASVLVLPSLIEGFGVPVVEAMAMRRLVVASGIPALREVGGGAPYFVDAPLDPDAWRSQLLSALAASEQERRQRVEAGVTRAHSYRWPDLVDQYASVLHDVRARS